MKQYRQIHPSPSGFFFRIKLPHVLFECEERYDTASDAAFFADLFKLVLVRRYSLTGNTMWPSLPPGEFSRMLAEVGADRASSESLTAALPHSCSEFLLNSGHELLTEFCEGQKHMRKEIS